MPPLTNNPKFKLWKQRADKEGATSANRMATNDFIRDEVPKNLKQSAQDITESYRAVIDAPGHLFKFMAGVALIYVIYEYNH